MSTISSQIASNKSKTVFLMVFFTALTSALAYTVGAKYGQNTTVMIMLSSFGYVLFSYFMSDKLAVRSARATEVTPSDEPTLHKVITEIARANSLPMPKVYVSPDPALNAFATGRNPNKAVVCATRGLLDSLTEAELKGVFAHELGHVKNYDIRISMLAAGLASAIAFLANMAGRAAFSGDSNDRGGSGVAALLGLFSMILAPIAATLIQLSISRSREYLADATGAALTGQPDHLADALEKIRDQGSVMRNQNASTAHMYFESPLRRGMLGSLFSTHPPVEERIRRLREM
jgi:heat shock protein HtpX